MTDFAIRLTFADQLENLGCKSIGFDALARPTTEHDTAFACRSDARSNSLAQQISLELGQCRHQRGYKLPLCAAQIELQPGLGDERDVPRLG